jgi:acetolactate synthase-1/2/3 large subunit
MAKITVSELILRALAGEGVRCMFSVPGAPLFGFYDKLVSVPEIRPVLARHEEGAAFMADGYARVSGQLGVCVGTTGPGTTNLVSGVATSYMDGVPVLVLTGNVPASATGKSTFQDSTQEGISSVDLLRPVTRYSAAIGSRLRAADMLRHALRAALAGKHGPVHLNMPKDVLDEQIDESEVPRPFERVRSRYFDRELVLEAAQALYRAARPVLLVGSGAVASGSPQEIVDLAELLAAPVATTPKAKGAFPESHPLSLGVFGFAGSPAAYERLLSGEHDVLLAIGTSFDEWSTLSWDERLQPTDALIHINIDPNEIGRNYPARIGLVGDANTVVNEIAFRLHGLMNEKGPPPHRRPVEDVARDVAARGRVIEPDKMLSDAVPIKPQRLTHEIRQAIPPDAIVFVDTGNHLAWTIHYLQCDRPGSFVAGLGLGTMGHGLAAAIGGKLARPDRVVVSIVGDGCFFMNGMEVATAVEHDVPVVWVVHNNAMLGMIHHQQTQMFAGRTVFSRFRRADFAKVAEGLGALGLTVTRPGEIRPAIERAIASGRPAVVDVIIDPDEVPPLETKIAGARRFAARLARM